MRNRIKCNHCGDIIESTHAHDFQRCTCGKVAIDGGNECMRRIYSQPSDYTELSVAPCKRCDSENFIIENLWIENEEYWAVRCFDCDSYGVDELYDNRQDAIVAWNESNEEIH